MVGGNHSASCMSLKPFPHSDRVVETNIVPHDNIMSIFVGYECVVKPI